jgi:hypothetical protein
MSEIAEEYQKYQVNVMAYSFPYIDTEYEYRDLRVERRGRLSEDRWAIVDMGSCYQPRGRRWAYERSNSGRTDKFMRASRMPLEQALPLAERLAKSKAKYWQERLARMILRQEAQEAARAAEKAREGA